MSPLRRPVNFITIFKKDGSIKGAWDIDPTLDIPSVFLPPLVGNEVRKNFNVVANDGEIDIDVTVLQGTDQSDINDDYDEAKKRVAMHIKANDGRIKARLVGPFYTNIS